MKNLEVRNLGTIETRSNEDNSRHVEGYALLFNSRSELLYGSFYEVIDRGAISQEMINSCDVFALLNHDDDKVLARSNQGEGSLTLTVDDIGLKYEFDAPNTALGDELLEHLRRGEIQSSSFAFYLEEDDEHERYEKIGAAKIRTIYKIDYIHDVSPVYTPAYPETTVSQRCLDNLKKLDEQEKVHKRKLIKKLDFILENILE